MAVATIDFKKKVPIVLFTKEFRIGLLIWLIRPYNNQALSQHSFKLGVEAYHNSFYRGLGPSD